jgi:RNA-directed DNA polymerase
VATHSLLPDKNTAGVDGVKSLTPKQRTNLVGKLKLEGKAKPTRRVNIPKPGTSETRPLGIPTINDRALQALCKMALEPEWEAKFEPNSYGFRLGRSCHDAIGAIFNNIKQKAKYVLDADIAKCFDRVRRESRVLGASALYDREVVLSRDSLLPIPA